jgi:DNA-binding NarL/FixJ family response regulator
LVETMAAEPHRADARAMNPTQETVTTCLLADDHPAILASVAAFLTDEGIDVVATARTGAEALRALELHGVAVAVLDQRLPDMTGVELARAIAAIRPDTAVLLYTGFSEAALVQEALDAGVCGIVLKDAPLTDLPRAIALVAEGGSYLDPVLGGALAGSRADEPRLTPREREVLRLLSKGQTNKEIGAELFLSPETVRTHVHKAVVRLGVRNRTEAVAKGLREGLIA